MYDKSQWQKSKGTHWVSLFIDRNTAVCFDSFGIEYTPQEVLNKIRIQNVEYYSIMCGFLLY